MKILLLISLVFIAENSVAQYDPHFAPNHDVIVHLFEWRWDDIAQECESFLGPMGYGGVQISPPNENVIAENRPWWERYQPVSYNLVTRSGNEDQLASMIRRCNNAGVRIYADVVVNHMAAIDGIGTAGSQSSPSSLTFPGVPFSYLDFHEHCTITDYSNPENVRNCELSGLKDLNQGNEWVRDHIVSYINHLVSLGVAGVRMDAAKHMWPSDLEQIYNRVNNLSPEHGFGAQDRPYIYQEVIDNDGNEGVHREEYTYMGAVTEFRYGLKIGYAFGRNQPLADLQSFGPIWGLLPDANQGIVFIDNHDTQRSNDNRILTHKNSKQYKMATAFMMAHPYANASKIMSSYAFENSDASPPNDSPRFNPDNSCINNWKDQGYICEHRWRQIYSMVRFKNVVKGTEMNNWWSNNDQQIAFSRGNRGFVAFTNGGDINASIQTGLPPGRYCDVISGDLITNQCTGRVIDVNENGMAYVVLEENSEDGVIAIHAESKIN